jgi:hypothetical protein
MGSSDARKAVSMARQSPSPGISADSFNAASTTLINLSVIADTPICIEWVEDWFPQVGRMVRHESDLIVHVDPKAPCGFADEGLILVLACVIRKAS